MSDESPLSSECAFHVEVEAGAVLLFHVGGKDVEEDADVLAVGEGDCDGGLGAGGGA